MGVVNTAANKFFSKANAEQLSTLTDVLSSAGRRAINLLKHDQLFNARSSSAAIVPLPVVTSAALVARGEDDELAVIIKDACSRELLDLGLAFNSLNIKAVLSEVAEARRRESAARAKADADVVQAQEEQRARIAQLEAAQKVNDQEKALNMQIASNGASRTFTVSFLIPAFGVLWGSLFLGEAITIEMALGCVVILIGTALTTWDGMR